MIRRIRELLFSLTGVIMAVLALSSFLVASYEMDSWPFGDRRPLRERYNTYRARRQELDPFLSAPGQVESARRTIVKCELENMAGSSGGTTQGSSTILWLIPEGSTVKKGDVLARLDASNYDEMLRQQAIVVEQARASHLQAQLDHEIAQIALREYMEGVAKESEQQMEASITLARSNLNQAEQRLEWTRKMNGKGYSSIAQMETDKQAVMTADLALQGQLSSYELFEKFTLPKTQKTLTADITTTRTTLESEEVKLNRQVERFKLLEKQVARCTIRAPHDGIVYYFFEAQRRGGNTEASTIEAGMPVYQEMKLFYLPDLADMEIQVILNESVVRRVDGGLGAHVEFEALPGIRLTGKMTNISQIPNRVNPRGEDVRYFIGTVKLDRSAEGLKPGMTAAVTFDLPRREGVLAVPLNAVGNERDIQVCYVLAGDHLERRPVQLGTTTAHLVEVQKGLVEGDEVILNPPDRGRLRSLAGFEDRPWPKVDPAQAAAARASGPRNPGGFGGGQRRNGGGGPGGGQGGFGGGQRRNGGGGPGDGGPGGGTRKSRKKAPVEDE